MLTVFTVAFPAIFIGDMPGDDIFGMSVSLRKLLGKPDRIGPVNGTAGAGIVPEAEFAFDAIGHCHKAQERGLLQEA